MTAQTKILIIGGGFGGINCALQLEAKKLKNTQITLVSQTPHFDYHAALYKLVSGTDPLEVCIPLKEIFKNKNVNLIKDKIIKIDLLNKSCLGGTNSTYDYDYLVIALGSDSIYYGIPGLEENSFKLKSITDAIRLKKQVQEVFHIAHTDENIDKVAAAHFVVVGAGASGVELAGELISYGKKLAKMHEIDESLVTVDLIERANRLLPSFPEKVSELAEKRLRELGVNIYLNREIVRSELEDVYFKDMEIKAKTLVWTAGIQANKLLAQTDGIELNKRRKLNVDKNLKLVGYRDVFVLGDCAETKYSGTAQTALHDGKYIANVIYSEQKGKFIKPYEPKPSKYVIPIGHDYAIASIGNTILQGSPAWILRQIVDLKALATFLPIDKALKAFKHGSMISTNCQICNPT